MTTISLLRSTLVAFILFISILIMGGQTNAADAKKEAPSKDPTQSQKLCTNPEFPQIRKALDYYLAGDTKKLARTFVMGGEESSGLDHFDKSYYRSPFFPLYTRPNHMGGGKVVGIIFKDKPDKAFDVWVYKMNDGRYEARSFTEVKDIDEKTAKKTVVEMTEAKVCSF